MAAPVGHENNVRIRVRYVSPILFKNRWALILYDECQSMRDVAKKILIDLNHYERDQFIKLCSDPFLEVGNNSAENSTHTFRSSSLCCQIYLDGLWLPGFENSRILRDKDEIAVQIWAETDRDASVNSSQILLSEKRNGYQQSEDCGNLEGASGDSCKRKSDASNEENSSEPKKQRLLSEKNLATRDCTSLNKTEGSEDFANRNKSQEVVPLSQPLDNSNRPSVRKIKKSMDLVSKDCKKTKVKEKNSEPQQSCSREDMQPAIEETDTTISCDRGSKKGGKKKAAKESESERVWSKSTQKYMQSLIDSKIQQLQSQARVKGDVESTMEEMDATIPCDREKIETTDVLREEPVDRTNDDSAQFIPPAAQQDQMPSKRKRKRKKKSAKRMPEISPSNVEVERDYKLRLPQHLKPPANNRVVFHDNDENGINGTDEFHATKDSSQHANSSPSSSFDKSLTSENPRQRNPCDGHWGAGESSSLNESASNKTSSSSFVSSDEKFESLLATNGHFKPGESDMDTGKDADFGRRKSLTKTERPTNSVEGNKSVIQRKALTSKVAERDDLASQVLSMRLTTQSDQLSDQTGEVSVDVSKAARQLMAAVVSPKSPPSAKLKLLSTQDRQRVPSNKMAPPNKATTVPSRKEVEQGVGIMPEVATHYSDLSTYPLMTSVPERGDTIAYKVLELSEFYTPVMSSYKKALVLEVDNQDRVTKLELYNDQIEKKREGRFELADEDDGDDEHDEDSPHRHLACFSWLEMKDTRLIHRP